MFPGRHAAVKALTCLALAGSALALLPPTGAGARADAAAGGRVLLGGVNIGGTYTSIPRIDREVAVAHALHAKVIRAEVEWSELQPVANGALDAHTLATVDRIVTDAARYGIKVIAFVDSTPCWASSAPPQVVQHCVEGRPSRAHGWPPSSPAEYGALMATLARRYGPHLAALEVWNEPDQANQRYFAGSEKAARYAALLRATYPAVKQAEPNVTVLAGSLVGSNGEFLRALYAAGIKGYYDGLAVHFYYLTIGAVRSIHEAQLSAGDTAPLWLDEFGWSSCWPKHAIEQEQACVTPRTQAENLATVFRTLAGAPYVAAAVAYKLWDAPREEFGVLTPGGAHKPSFAALARVLASQAGRPAPVRLHLRRAHGRLIARGSGPVGDFMVLEAFRGKTLRYRALFTLDRFNRFSLRLPRRLGTKLRVRVYQYWWGPSRAAVAHA
jgi:polysaccharide biosynthesis protein PslG